jgi:fatty acid-binding protein DegV
VADLCQEAVDGCGVERLAIIHVNAPDEADEFAALLRGQVACPDEVVVAELSPGLSVHSGAGLVGAAFVAGASPG